MTDLSTAASFPSSPTPANGVWQETLDTLRTIGVALLVALLIQTVVFQPFTIPSSSMGPGLMTGDYIVVSKFSYGWSRASLPFNPPVFRGRAFGRAPERGDVVVFRRPSDPQETWVKRVIGLPGDRVQLRDGRVFVNGRALPQVALGLGQDRDSPERRVMRVRETASNGRAYVIYDTGPNHLGDDTPVQVVPEGFYFTMGDNRDNSLDSRWPGEVGVGLLPAENLVGKARIVVASWRPGSGLLKPWTWFNLRLDRFLRPIR